MFLQKNSKILLYIFLDMSWSKLWEIVKGREAWHAVVHAVSKSQT